MYSYPKAQNGPLRMFWLAKGLRDGWIGKAKVFLLGSTPHWLVAEK